MVTWRHCSRRGGELACFRWKRWALLTAQKSKADIQVLSQLPSKKALGQGIPIIPIWKTAQDHVIEALPSGLQTWCTTRLKKWPLSSPFSNTLTLKDTAVWSSQQNEKKNDFNHLILFSKGTLSFFSPNERKAKDYCVAACYFMSYNFGKWDDTGGRCFLFQGEMSDLSKFKFLCWYRQCNNSFPEFFS